MSTQNKIIFTTQIVQKEVQMVDLTHLDDKEDTYIQNNVESISSVMQNMQNASGTNEFGHNDIAADG